MENLIVTVDDYNLGDLGNSLRDKLATLHRMLSADKKPQACGAADNFIRHVDKEEGQGLYDWQAWHLRTAAPSRSRQSLAADRYVQIDSRRPRAPRGPSRA